MEFELLAQYKALIPIIAKWYFDEWGSIVEEASVERFEQKLLDYLNESAIPCVIVALDGDTVAGVVQRRHPTKGMNLLRNNPIYRVVFRS